MRLSKLTTVIASSVFILVVGMILNIAVLYWMSGILLSLPGVGWLYAVLQTKGVTVRRRLAPVGNAGETVTMELEARNTSALPKLQIWLTDTLPPGLATDSAPQVSIHLPPLALARGSYPVRLARRGRHRIEETRLVSLDPLGLSAVSVEQPAPAEILVYPHVVPLRPGCLPLGSDGGTAHEEDIRRRGDGTTFHGIRQYQPGDPLRRVHWRSSARWGRLAVVEFEEERSSELILALETRRGSAAGKEPETSFEYAVTLAASLATLAAQRGHPVRLLLSDAANASDEAGRPTEGLPDVLERLAAVEAVADRSLAESIPNHASQLPFGANLVWITPLAEPALLDAARSILARRVTLAVLGIDRASFGGRSRSYPDWRATSEQLRRLGAHFAQFRKDDALAPVLESLWRTAG
jgi:uncharacterized repeat protein (TIGR01451 family)